MSTLSSAFRMRDIDVQGWEPSSSSLGDANSHIIPVITLLAAQRIPIPDPSTHGNAKALAQDASTTFSFRHSSGPSSVAIPAPSSPFPRPASITSPPSSRSPAAAGRMPQRARTSTERKIARKLAENAAYVPRPRNSFIIFRTDFVAYRMSTELVRPLNMSSATYDALTELMTSKEAKGNSKKEEEGSLSKQASDVWNRLTESQRQPWAERAEKEKALHAERHPEYRYKPARHGPVSTSSRKPNESRSRSGSRVPKPPVRTVSFPQQQSLSLPSVPPVPLFAANSSPDLSARHLTSSPIPMTGSPSPSSPASSQEAVASASAFAPHPNPYQTYSTPTWPSELTDNLSSITEAASWASSKQSPAALSRPGELVVGNGLYNDGLAIKSLGRSLSSDVLSSSGLLSSGANNRNRDIEETIDVDIDMHSFLAISQFPTPSSEACANSTLTGKLDGASPLEAIANLWIHDKGRVEKAGGPPPPFSQPRIASPADAAFASAEPSVCAIGDLSFPFLSESNDYPVFDLSDQPFSIYDDFGLNLDAELAQAGYGVNECIIPASTLSFSALSSGCSPNRPSFALEHERRGVEMAVGSFYGRLS